MSLGRPAITTPRGLDLRAVQDAVTSARQRIEAIERALATVSAQAGQTAFAGGGGSNATTAALQAQVTTLRTDVNALQGTIDDLLALDDGLVVVAAGTLLSRVLQAGANVTITNANGTGGNPEIAVAGAAGGDAVLYDDTGRALLTGAGQALLAG